MIRPIDTQTIYQQTQEIANRQQVYNQNEHNQQGQFAHIMQKETEIKKESVNELEKNQKIDNHLNKDGNNQQNNAKQNKKKKFSKNKPLKKWGEENRIDIRI